MHQRTWLTLLTLPIVVTFTVPMFNRQAPKKPAVVDTGTTSTSDPLAGLADIQDVIGHIRNNYVDVPDMQKALAGGIRGALERANPLNSYLTSEETQMPDPGAGETGLTLLKNQLLAIVIGVAPGSPAAVAGFQIGDRVRKLDGDSLGPMSHWAMERRLRGSVGSEVELVRMSAGTSELKKLVLKREKLQRPAIESSVEPKTILVVLPDLTTGREQELRDLLNAVGTKRPLIVDLRTCNGGSYEEAAKVAALLGNNGLFATLHEAGKPDHPLNIPATEEAGFTKIAVLTGIGTLGPAEALASALRHPGSQDSKENTRTVITLGERTIGMAVERRRLSLKHGDAVELVTRHWTASGGERLDKVGSTPDYTLRGIDEKELMPRVLEALEKAPVKPKEVVSKVARLTLYSPHYPVPV